MSEVIVIGGGAAGMMAAITAAQQGNSVVLYEKNEKLGKKLYITGKGRCNFTNAGKLEELYSSIVSNPKFLYSAFRSFSNEDAMRFFESLGLAYKIERGNRVFPASDHASDVTAALAKELGRQGVDVRLRAEVTDIHVCDGMFNAVTVREAGASKKVRADAAVIATGGCSYPSTGSTGDGYKFAKKLGHTVETPRPALVPLSAAEEWVSRLQGLSLKNAGITVIDGSRRLYSGFGEMLFTHFGVSGPMILSASSYVAKACRTGL